MTKCTSELKYYIVLNQAAKPGIGVCFLKHLVNLSPPLSPFANKTESINGPYLWMYLSSRTGSGLLSLWRAWIREVCKGVKERTASCDQVSCPKGAVWCSCWPCLTAQLCFSSTCSHLEKKSIAETILL